MHGRRFACLILGIWLGGCLAMDFMAYRSRKLADSILADASPEARIALKPLGPNAQAVLAYHAAEEVRWYRKNWGLIQVGVGTIFFLGLLFGSRESGAALLGVLCLILLTGIQRFFVTSQLFMLGRLVDFVPVDQPAPDRNRLLVLESFFYGLEALKCFAILFLSGRLIFSTGGRASRSRDSRSQFDRVNKPNYRGINR